MRQNASLNFPGHRDDLKHIFLIIVLWVVINFHSWIGSQLYTYVKRSHVFKRYVYISNLHMPQWHDNLHYHIMRMVPTAGRLLLQTVRQPKPIPVLSALGREDHSLAVVWVRSPSCPSRKWFWLFKCERRTFISVFSSNNTVKGCFHQGNRAFRPTCLSQTQPQTPRIVLPIE